MDRHICMVNRSFLNLFGYQQQDIVGCKISTIYAREKDFANAVQGRFAPTADPSRRSYLMRYKRGDGSEFWGLTVGGPMLGHRGETIGFIGNIIDYSKEVETKQEFETVRHRLEVALEASQIGVWEYSVPDQGLIWDTQMYRIYGVTPEQFSGAYEAWAKGLHPEDAESAQKNLADAIAGVRPFDCEFRVLCPDGTVRYVRAKAKVVRDAQGKPLKMFGVNWDVTKEREQELKLIEAKAQADRANHAKSQFLSNMSHEIRTPMNGVLGMAEVLMAEDLNVVQTKCVSTIVSSGRSMMNVLNDILDYSKIEMGHLKIELHDFDLHELLRSTISLFETIASEKSLSFELDMEDRIPQWVNSDSTRLRQVLSNLISNAIKFTEKGRVLLSVKVDSQPQNQGYRVLFCVQDTGLGIDQEIHDLIFASFTQADESTTRKFGGTGLGLAISRQLVNLLGGELRLTSELGKGSCFYFSLPLGEATKHSPQEKRVETAFAKEIKILLAEDNHVNREVVMLFLQQLGLSADTVVDGEQACAKACKQSYDLIFMDCQMPKMDGFVATRKIRECIHGKSSVIIALTAHAMETERQKCLAAGMDDFITKPLSKSRLEEKLAHWFPLGGASPTSNTREA